nr:ATP-binding protein [Pleionea sp. CnH1-48]
MQNKDALLTLQFEAYPHNLKEVRGLVCQHLKAADFGREVADEVVLAVDEACQNIIRHAYQSEQGGLIDLALYLTNNTLSVELVDYAQPCNPDCCVPKPREPLQPGGLGLHFMNELMDSVSYEKPPAGAGNRLVMTKTHNNKNSGNNKRNNE